MLQGDSFGSIRESQSIAYLASPGYLIRAASRSALRPILIDGVTVMERIALHMVPSCYYERHPNYSEARKIPNVAVVYSESDAFY